MQKVAIFGHNQARDQIMSMLQKRGIIEIASLSRENPVPEELCELELDLAEIKSALDFLEKSSGRKKSFIETFAPFKERIDEELFLRTAREFNWKEIVSALKRVEDELSNAVNLDHKLRNELQLLHPWQGLNFKLDQLVCSRKICITAGSCPSKNMETLGADLAGRAGASQLETASVIDERTYFLLFYIEDHEKNISEILHQNNFDKIVLPLSARTPAEEVRHLENLARENREDIARYKTELTSFQKHQTKLGYVYDYLAQKYSEISVRAKFAFTKNAFILTGWIPKKTFSKLNDSIQHLSPLAEMRPVPPDVNETIPTLIENPKIFYPFEMITRIFGLPAQNEMDPTGPLSFFYLFFFAFCLSDVGYGLILALVTFYYIKTLTLSEGGKKLLWLLFWGGIATIFMGMLTGSYFAIDLNSIPAPLGEWLKKLQIIDPIKNPLNVLLFSLAVGVVQNIFGVGLAMYWKLKNRDFYSAFLDDGLWIYFLFSLVLFSSASALRSPLSDVFGKMSIVGAGLLVLTQGRKENGLIKKALLGILSLYRTTSYLGDTLSYSRLLALMMTTSIIGMVINILAGLTKDSVPVLGYFLMAAILIFGHVFNMVVSVLGAFIHAARLQLVEFFGKFYGGGGREFRPFQRETKYVIIK